MTHKNLLAAIGKNVKEERLEKGIKGEWLGKKLEISKAAVSQMENGQKDFRVSELFKIAEILETDVCKLVSVQTIHSKKEFEKIKSLDKPVFIDAAVVQHLIDEVKILKQEVKGIRTAKSISYTPHHFT